jgi:O-antigen/teichoic acid export membrane protein
LEGVKRNTFFVGVGQVLRIVLAFVLLPVASRILGDELFGSYNLATTIMFFVMLVDDFGLNMWVTREIAKYKDRAERYFAFTAGLKIVLLFGSLLFVLLVTFIMPYDQTTIQAILIFSIYGVLLSFRDLAIAIFRAFEDMKWETVVLSLERILVTAFGVTALILGWGLVGLAWAFVAAAITSLFVSLIIVRKKFFQTRLCFSLKEFKPMIKGASVFGISIFLTTMYSRIDMLMLSVMKSPEVWGWYAAAHKLIDFTNVVPTVLMIATFPAFARVSGQFQDVLPRMFTRGFKYLFILAIPIVPGIYLLSEQIILLVNGAEFVNAVPALKVLSFTAAILFINIFAAGLFGATNNQGKLVIFQIIGLALNAGINLVLIPRYSHVGAALSTVATEFVVLVITLVYTFKKLVKLTEKKFIVQVLLAAFLMTLFLFVLKDLPLMIVVAAAIAIYFSILFFLKTITLSEILNFRRSAQ